MKRKEKGGPNENKKVRSRGRQGVATFRWIVPPDVEEKKGGGKKKRHGSGSGHKRKSLW